MEIIKKQSVLIIDDDHVEVMIAKRVISRIAPELWVEAAFSGDAGLALLTNGKPLPSLILLDLKMPGVSGIDVIRRIRADERLKNLPVIILTNSTLESDRQRSIAEGATDYLHKACSIDQFSRDIKALLERYLRNQS